jgi:hypothetical protein
VFRVVAAVLAGKREYAKAAAVQVQDYKTAHSN